MELRPLKLRKDKRGFKVRKRDFDIITISNIIFQYMKHKEKGFLIKIYVTAMRLNSIILLKLQKIIES